MKFNKLSKTSVSLLFIMVSVAILIIPASAISYSETLTTQNILSVQGDYVNGTGIQTIAINQTLPTSDFPVQTELNETIGFDSALYGYRATGSALTRWSIFWDDMQTYLGNDTYQMDVNYSEMPYPAYNNRMILVQLDTNNSDWVNYDFIKVITDYEYSMTIVYQTDLNNVASLNTIIVTTTTNLYVNTLSIKAEMTNYPSGKIWLLFEIPDSASVDTQFNFNVQGYVLSPADSFMWDDDQIYVLILLGSDMIMIFGFVFTTNMVDITIDKSKPRKPKTYKRKK